MAKKILFTLIFFTLSFSLTGSQLDFIDNADDGQGSIANLAAVGQESFHDGDLWLRSDQVFEPTGDEGRAPSWISYGQANVWTPDEIETVNQVFEHTFDALATVGLDGHQLLADYRINRYQGEYVDGVPGQLAVVDHQQQTITLSDAAFNRHHGFNLYHELGHVVDHQLGRQASQLFHKIAGSQEATSWVTADGYWLRQHGRNDREEATADAFALWVMDGQTDYPRPVFYGTPLTVNYEAIEQAMNETLLAIGVRSPFP